MKYLLFTPLLLLFFPSQSQTKGKAFFKIAPGFVFPKEGDAVPSIAGSFGGEIGKSIALGIGAGYYKFKGSKEAVIPVGVELNFTDFTKRKILPVMVIGLYYPAYSEVSTGIKTIGRYQYQISGGIAFPITEHKKVFLTGGFSQLGTKTEIRVGNQIRKEGNSLSMFLVNLSFKI